MADSSYRINRGLTLNPQSSVPNLPTNGDIYYDSTLSTFAFYNNSKWINLASRVDVASASSLTSTQFTAVVVQHPLIRITGSTTANVHGLTASTDGKQVTIYNISTQTLTIKNQSVTEGTAANRITTLNAADITLVTGQTIVLVYDSAQSLWVATSSITGVDLTTAQTLSNKSFIDNVTFFLDDGDNTKKMSFQCSGISTGTTRTLTIPDASGTIALLNLAQTFSATQTISVSSGFPLTLANTGANDPHIKFDSGGTSNDVKIGITSGTFEILDNGNNVRGSVTQAGLWTLGTSSGTQTHLVNGQVSIMAGASGFPLTVAKSGSDPHIKFDTGGSNDIKVGATSAGTLEVLDNGNTSLGQVSQAGQWTLGKGTGTQSGPKIYGVNDGTTATTGTIGQCVSARITSASNYAATGTWGDITSISLTAGHWLISGVVISDLNGSVTTALDMALSAFSGTTTTDQQPGDNELEYGPPTTAYDNSMSIPSWEQNISSTTTYYIKGRATYSAGNPRYRGRISAVRIR